MAYAEEIGFPERGHRARVRAADALPADLVYAGFSLGVVPAQKLPRPAPERAERCCSTPVFPTSDSGLRGRPTFPCRSTAWMLTRSSWARATSTPPANSSSRAREAELFLYPGDQHYFADSSLPSYVPEAAALLRQRVLEFLATR